MRWGWRNRLYSNHNTQAWTIVNVPVDDVPALMRYQLLLIVHASLRYTDILRCRLRKTWKGTFKIHTSLAFFVTVVTYFRCRDNNRANMPSVLHPADIFCLILHQINCLYKHKISSNYNLFSWKLVPVMTPRYMFLMRTTKGDGRSN